MTSGFRIRLDAFLPCSNTLADMLAASARLEDLRRAMEAAGLIDVKRSDTFVKVQRQRNSEGPSGTAREAPSTGVQPAAPPTAATEDAPLPESAGGGEDLLSLEGTHLDRSANRKPAA